MRTFATRAIFALLLALAPAVVAFGREEVKVTMQDLLKEISSIRKELRELKIQRDRDQRVIEDLRRVVENGAPGVAPATPQPAVAKPR